jgi:membrane protein required for beta-lactamase induction
MSFLAILLTIVLEQQRFLKKLRLGFHQLINRYVSFFIERDFTTVRQIRLHFIYAMLPFILVTLLLMVLPYNRHDFVYFLINCSFFILCADMLAWKEEAKQTNRSKDFQQFVQSYATKFFATTLWFILLPSVLGAICYLTLNAMGNKLRIRSEESMVYSLVVDKMLFWINIVPYSLLAIFIAIAGDFEQVMHHVIEQRGKVKVSFFYLENVLNELAFIAIGKDKFSKGKTYEIEGIEEIQHANNLFDPKVVDYVVALLYRSGIFFIFIITCISIANLL